MSNLKIIPLGGMGHVTKNMFLYELGEERIIVDCGLGFPDPDMYGVDFLIPDISYLAGKEETVKAIILTHGHDDHIGALPYILPKLPDSVPVYGSKLTLGFTEDTLKDFSLSASMKELPDQPFRLGSFTIDSLAVTHSVPDSRHLIIQTPSLTVYHGSDFKIDFSPLDKKYMDLQKIAWYGHRGIDLLLLDCLRIEKTGYSASESSLTEVFEREIEDCQGRLLVTTMSSNIHRIQQAVNVMANHHRKVAFLGRSIEENIKTATRLGYFHLPSTGMVPRRKVDHVSPDKMGLIVAGSQGQVDSALVKIAKGENEKIRIQPGDKVVFSTDIIPGNENAFYTLIDQLSKRGAEVSYYDILDDLHVSGHASRKELELMMSLIKPKFSMPIGGTFRQMVHFKNMAAHLGFKPESVFLLEDDQTLMVEPQRVYLGPELRLKTIIVDGSGIGDVGKVVLQDRRRMADDGIVVVVLTVDRLNHTVLVDPEIITRGFVFVRASQDFIQQLSDEVWQVIPKDRKIVDPLKIKDSIINHLEQFIFDQTQRNPMILPVIIKINE
jgi:ribonuclease J